MSLRSHLRYLRYVLLHKLYVFRAGCLIGGYGPRWLWRLLVHDLSKFSRAEWSPYVCQFYGEPAVDVARREVAEHEAQYGDSWTDEFKADRMEAVIATRAKFIEADRRRAFNAAWLHHIHANPHHWQHWMLHEDSGKTIILVPPPVVVDEMIADWLGAGSKVLLRPDMRTCVAETIAWYAKAHTVMQLRLDVRSRVEQTLLGLARHYRLDQFAEQIKQSRESRASISL